MCSVCGLVPSRHPTLIDHFTGGLIGTLPTEQHGVSGQFYIVDSKNIFFDNFNYDGGGPGERERDCFYILLYLLIFTGAYLYYYSPGVAVSRFGGGHIIPLPSSVGQ